MNLKRQNSIKSICRTLALTLLVALPLSMMADDATSADNSLSVNDSERFNYFVLEALNQQEKGNFTAAFDLFSHARDINPKAAETYYELAGFYVEMKQDSLMRWNYRKAAALNPKNSTYMERLAQTYVNDQNYDEAAKAYERLYATNRSRGDVLEMLYQIYGLLNDYDKMIDVIDRLETLNGSSEQYTLARMNIYQQQGKEGKAIDVLRQVAEKHPNDLNYRVMLGNLLLQNGKVYDALTQYDAVLKEEPDNTLAQMSKLDYFRAVADTTNADALLSHLLRSSKTDDDSKAALLRQAVSIYQGNPDNTKKMLAFFDDALSTPQNSGSLYILKAAYMEFVKMPTAEVDSVYMQALKVEPDNSAARFSLVRDTWNKKDYDGVIELCKPAQQYNPDDMTFYYFQGIAESQKGDNDAALATLRKGVSQINSTSNAEMVSDFYAIMGDIFHEKNMEKEAFAAYDSCLQWKPDNVGCLNNYAYYLSLGNKDLKRAEQMSYKTIMAEPNNSTFLDTYAWILFQEGRYTDARTYIDRAIANDTTLSGVVKEHAGDIYYMAGDKTKAIDFWKRAEKAGNTSKALRQKILTGEMPAVDNKQKE